MKRFTLHIAIAALLGLQLLVPPSADSRGFSRGDANGDRAHDLADAVTILSYLFGGDEMACLRAGDTDDNDKLEITDAVYLLNYLFLGGFALPAPFPECDATIGEGSLGCEVPQCDVGPPAGEVWMSRACMQCQPCGETLINELLELGVEIIDTSVSSIDGNFCFACDVCPTGVIMHILVPETWVEKLEAMGWVLSGDEPLPPPPPPPPVR